MGKGLAQNVNLHLCCRCATWRLKRAMRVCLTKRACWTKRRFLWRKNVRKLKRENACFRSDIRGSSTSNVRLWDTTLPGVLQVTKLLLLRRPEKKSRAMPTNGVSVNVEEAGERAARAVNDGKVHGCNQPCVDGNEDYCS